METSKKLLISSAAASVVCIILNVLGVLSVESRWQSSDLRRRLGCLPLEGQE